MAHAELHSFASLFDVQLEFLTERLVNGIIIDIFNQRGIPIEYASTQANGVYQGRRWELGVMAKNIDTVIIFEVKTTLEPDDVKKHLQKLPMVKKWIRQYENNNIYGAVAYLTDTANAAQMAEEQGLFVIKATEDTAYITNSEAFKPKSY